MFMNVSTTERKLAARTYTPAGGDSVEEQRIPCRGLRRMRRHENIESLIKRDADMERVRNENDEYLESRTRALTDNSTAASNQRKVPGSDIVEKKKGKKR